MHLRRLIVLLALGLSLPFFALATDAPAGRANRALLVGCDRFLSQQDTTPSSANNVETMAQALSGGTMELTALTTRPDGVSTTGELAGLILDTFAEADDDDVSIFYISTHGEWEAGHSGATVRFLLSDGERESGVTARQLRTMFDQVRGHKVLLLDACHAGAVVGKGVDAMLSNVFAGPDYTVVCSSGGAEESWFWSGDIDGERLAGAGYFSGALVRGLSMAGGYGADDDRDGRITLTELRRYLLRNHGASTVRTYPEDSSLAILTYDASAYTGREREAAIEGVSFDSDVLSVQEPTAYFTFNVVRSVQMAYQVVYHRQGRWDFDNAELIYDNNGNFGPWPVAGRNLTPGLKERAITIDREEAGSSGYVLLQLLTFERGIPSVASARVLCVPPESGDPSLAVESPSMFCPAVYEELTFIVRHDQPCELTVTIEDAEGNTVRRLVSRQATRPEQIKGTSLTWDGFCADGTIAPAGSYRIRVRAYVGTEKYECLSDEVILLELVG